MSGPLSSAGLQPHIGLSSAGHSSGTAQVRLGYAYSRYEYLICLGYVLGTASRGRGRGGYGQKFDCSTGGTGPVARTYLYPLPWYHAMILLYSTCTSAHDGFRGARGTIKAQAEVPGVRPTVSGGGSILGLQVTCILGIFPHPGESDLESD